MFSLTVYLVLTVGFLLSILTYWSHLKKSKRTKELINRIPGPKPLPIIGNALTFNVNRSEIIAVLINLSKKWPRIFRVWLFGHPWVFFTHPETIAPIVNDNSLSDHSAEYQFVQQVIGRGVTMLSGNEWKNRRKMLTPSFHYRTVEGFIPIFNQQSYILTSILKNQLGRRMDIAPFCFRCTFDNICEATMGYQPNSLNQKGYNYSHAVDRLSHIISKRMMSPWLWPDWLFYRTSMGKKQIRLNKIVNDWTDKVIAERKKIRWQRSDIESKPVPTNDLDELEEPKKSSTFLDLLLDLVDAGQELSDVDIRDEVTGFLIAGHETTAMSLALTLFLLGHHPEIQQKVHEELDFIFGEDSERAVTQEDVGKMKYLDRVMKEQLRIYPTVPMFGRLVKEDIIIDGCIIPKGTTAMCATYLMHQNPEIYQNPHIFDPDRFLPVNVEKRHPCAFLPFSGGRRICMGIRFNEFEMKVTLAWILRLFRIKSLQTFEGIQLELNITFAAKNGFPICLSLRKEKHFN